MPKIYPYQDFQSQVNQEFQIEQEPGKWIEAILIEASELEYKYPETDKGQSETFSLVFRAGKDVNLPQNTYTIKNENLGENQMFLVPLQPDDEGTYYEAVFT